MKSYGWFNKSEILHLNFKIYDHEISCSSKKKTKTKINAKVKTTKRLRHLKINYMLVNDTKRYKEIFKERAPYKLKLVKACLQ